MQLWVKMTIMVAIAALLGNSYCYARCLSSAPNNTASASHEGCHHCPDSKQSNSKHCSNQHYLELANPDSQAHSIKIGPSSESIHIPAFADSHLRFGVRWLAFNGAHSRDSISDDPLSLSRSVLRL
jgi:hypothetical protein